MSPRERPGLRGVWKRPGFWLGLAVFLAVAYVPSGLHEIPGHGHRPALAAAVAALMAVWWFTEALPISLTACLPLLLHPLLGVYGESFAGEVGHAFRPFVDAYIFLFLGGMMIGAAMEESQLHRRIALQIMRRAGTDPRRLLLGMLAATALVSLWISNTATAVMMMPIARALLTQLARGKGRERLAGYGGALMLAVAYACNLGGIGSKIGTGTNSIFAGFVSQELGIEISFLEFLALGLPFVVLFMPLVWWVLWRLGRDVDLGEHQARQILDRELEAMGGMSGRERRVAAVFCAAAVLWVLGDPLRRALTPFVESLAQGFDVKSKHYEAAVAMTAGLSLFALRALSFRAFLGIPWGTLLLLGGSFALAAGIEGSGLSTWLALELAPVGRLPHAAQLALAAGSGVLLSAVASNTATVSVLLNVLPRSLPVLTSVTLASSCDFMLPAGTPPNAIVFGSGYVKLPVMMRTGFVLDLAAVVAITVYTLLYVPLVLG